MRTPDISSRNCRPASVRTHSTMRRSSERWRRSTSPCRSIRATNPVDAVGLRSNTSAIRPIGCGPSSRSSSSSRSWPSVRSRPGRRHLRGMPRNDAEQLGARRVVRRGRRVASTKVQAHADSTRIREVSSSLERRLASAGVAGAARAGAASSPARSRSSTASRSCVSTSSSDVADQGDRRGRRPPMHRIPTGRGIRASSTAPGDQERRRDDVDVARRGRLLGAELRADETGDDEEGDARDEHREHDRRDRPTPDRARRPARGGRRSPDDQRGRDRAPRPRSLSARSATYSTRPWSPATRRDVANSTNQPR